MKLPDNIVKELIREVVGPDGVPLVEIILKKENVSEFKIAEKLKITVNQVRNILYRLQDHNLVLFTRKKDKSKGWYIYFWTFDHAKARILLLKHKAAKLEVLKLRIEKERDSAYFVCPNKDMRAAFENAMELQFKCPECGEVLKQEDNQAKMAQVETEINKLEQEIKQFEFMDIDVEEPKQAKPVKVQKAKKVAKNKSKKVKSKKPAKKVKSKSKPKKKGFFKKFFKKKKKSRR
ncbi:MAG: hypothetical protein Q8L27_01935 [archaeon]|nr:hypothetical protein [archaeon]